jgi:hypothetical protein
VRSLHLLIIFAFAFPAHAQARPDARSMTCDEVRTLIRQRGAVVLTTGRYTYKRFVAHRGFCLYSERIGHEWVETSDTPECRLRICVEPLRYKRRGFR